MLDKMSWGSRLGHALMVLRALMLGCLAAGLLAAGALAQSTPAPPSSKVDQLIELLNDPAVKAWLDSRERGVDSPAGRRLRVVPRRQPAA